jgi:hypothetical protein
LSYVSDFVYSVFKALGVFPIKEFFFHLGFSRVSTELFGKGSIAHDLWESEQEPFLFHTHEDLCLEGGGNNFSDQAVKSDSFSHKAEHH